MLHRLSARVLGAPGRVLPRDGNSTDVVTQNLNYWFFTLGLRRCGRRTARAACPEPRSSCRRSCSCSCFRASRASRCPAARTAARVLHRDRGAARRSSGSTSGSAGSSRRAAILLAGAFLTKREGLLLGACVVFAAGRRVVGGPPVGLAASRGRSGPLLSRSRSRGASGSRPRGIEAMRRRPASSDSSTTTVARCDSLWLAVRAMFGYDLWLVLPARRSPLRFSPSSPALGRPPSFTLAFVGVTARRERVGHADATPSRSRSTTR